MAREYHMLVPRGAGADVLFKGGLFEGYEALYMNPRNPAGL